MRYVTGQGVLKDDGEGLRWFKAAADQGHADAQYDLGTMYETGQGTEADLPLAVYYYKLAAQQGVVKAQYRLGILLTKGPDIEGDRVSAYKWFWRCHAGSGQVVSNRIERTAPLDVAGRYRRSGTSGGCLAHRAHATSQVKPQIPPLKVDQAHRKPSNIGLQPAESSQARTIATIAARSFTMRV